MCGNAHYQTADNAQRDTRDERQRERESEVKPCILSKPAHYLINFLLFLGKLFLTLISRQLVAGKKTRQDNELD